MLKENSNVLTVLAKSHFTLLTSTICTLRGLKFSHIRPLIATNIHFSSSFFLLLSNYDFFFLFEHDNRLNLLELGFAAFLFVCGCYDYVHGKHNYFIYLFLQTLTFSIVGFGYVGTIV